MNAPLTDKKLERIRAKHIKQCGLLEYTFDDYNDVEYLLQLIDFKSGQLAQRDELLDECEDIVRWITAQEESLEPGLVIFNNVMLKIELMRYKLQERNK